MSTLAERMAISFKEIQTTNPSKTKAGLARAAGVTPSSVSDWFNGRTKQLRFDVANRAAAYLEVSAMEPFIWDGDTILVDCTPQQIMGGKTYAFMLHGDMRVKMLYPLMKGQLLVKSLNPDVPDETLGSDDLDTFELIGRVRDRSGDAKL